MLQNIPVMDKTNNYRLWEHIQKITWFHILLAWEENLSFTDISKQRGKQPCKANKRWCSLEVRSYTQASVEIQSYKWWNHCLMAWFNLTLTSTSSCIVAIDVDSCSVIITWIILLTMLLLLQAYGLHNQVYNEQT